MHKTHIRNDTEHIIPVLVENTDSFLVGSCQFDFRTTTHTKRLLVTVKRLLGKHLALLQYKLIQMRQSGRIETDRIFHQQNDLHAYTLRIVGRIPLIFNKFNNSQQQFGIPQPTEYIVDRTQVFIGYTFGILG